MVDNIIKVQAKTAPIRTRIFKPLSIEIQNLQPNTEYKIWIEAKNSHKKISQSEIKSVKTYEAPNLIKLVNLTPRSVKLEWKSPEFDLIQFHQILLESNSENITVPKNLEITQAKQNYSYEIENLIPATKYVMKILVIYKTKIKGVKFIWPNDNRSKFMTPNSKPKIPGMRHFFSKIHKICTSDESS